MASTRACRQARSTKRVPVCEGANSGVVEVADVESLADVESHADEHDSPEISSSEKEQALSTSLSGYEGGEEEEEDDNSPSSENHEGKPSPSFLPDAEAATIPEQLAGVLSSEVLPKTALATN